MVICDDCSIDSKPVVYWKGKNRCLRCDKLFENGKYFKEINTIK